MSRFFRHPRDALCDKTHSGVPDYSKQGTFAYAAVIPYLLAPTTKHVVPPAIPVYVHLITVYMLIVIGSWSVKGHECKI